MYIANVTDGYDNITDYDNITSTNCTNNDNIIEIIFFLTIIPCGIPINEYGKKFIPESSS